MFDWLISLVKKLLAFLKKFWAIILIVILIIVAIYFPVILAMLPELLASAWAWMGTAASGIASFFAALGIEGAIAAALGIGILIDPEGVGEGVAAVIGGVGDAVGSVAGELFSSPLGIAAVGIAAIFFLSSGSDDDGDQVVYEPQDDGTYAEEDQFLMEMQNESDPDEFEGPTRPSEIQDA